MRRIVTALAGTVTALLMLFGYHTSTAGSSATALAPTTPTAPAAGGSGSSSSSGSGSSGSSDGSGGSGSSGSSGSSSGTFTGDTVGTQWGPVQVQITVSNGRVTDVTPLQYPSGNPMDEQINAYALPILRQSALAAQGADFDLVSGATITSQGYVGSLQSALDQANL